MNTLLFVTVTSSLVYTGVGNAIRVSGPLCGNVCSWPARTSYLASRLPRELAVVEPPVGIEPIQLALFMELAACARQTVWVGDVKQSIYEFRSSDPVLISAVIAVITAINIRGIKQSSVVVNIFTVGKLAPLVVFVLIGVFYVDPSALLPGQPPGFNELAATTLLLIFAFGGYEVVPVPAGEARDPRTAVPFALIMTIAVVTVLMILVQIVALGTLPGLAKSSTPSTVRMMNLR